MIETVYMSSKQLLLFNGFLVVLTVVIFYETTASLFAVFVSIKLL